MDWRVKGLYTNYYEIDMKNMTIHIIYENYLNPNGEGISVGGIQTYITNLISVFLEIELGVVIHQRADTNFEKIINNGTVRVYGYRYTGSIRRFPQYLFNNAIEHIDKQKDIILFGTDSLICDSKGYKTLAIQHGVFWDKPQPYCSNVKYLVEYLKQSYRAWRTIKTIRKVDRLICVDYNFVNWYRALVAFPQITLRVIPNFSVIEQLPQKSNKIIKIIFARRLFLYRGTRIFASAVKKLLKLELPIDVTIAGEGPDEDYLKQLFKDNHNVHFIKYDSTESLAIHSDKDIAVIPTVGSEGTSLSLLEAMSAKCAVICSNVGGMTNIVLNRYNGIMINPNEQELFQALLELINNHELRQELSIKAQETVAKAFSLELWQKEWRRVIKEVLSDIACESN